MPDGARALELDVGNTRIKWRWLDAANQRLSAGAAARSDGVPTWIPGADDVDAVSVRVVSVAGDTFDAELASALTDAGFAAPRFARSTASRAGLRSGYEEPERLGADRWVAMLAAVDAAAGPCAVLDAGSAITFDQIDAAGRHEGGWIVPGLGLMRRSLLRETAGIRFRDDQVDCGEAPGATTAQAVHAGTLHMARDFTRNRWAAFRDRFPGAVLFVTGGDGEALASDLAGVLEGDVRLTPELVLDGLRVCVD